MQSKAESYSSHGFHQSLGAVLAIHSVLINDCVDAHTDTLENSNSLRVVNTQLQSHNQFFNPATQCHRDAKRQMLR